MEVAKVAGAGWRSLTQEEKDVSHSFPSYLSFPAINVVETFSSVINLNPPNQAQSREISGPWDSHSLLDLPFLLELHACALHRGP